MHAKFGEEEVQVPEKAARVYAMEQKRLLISALGLGVGVGIGVGRWTGGGQTGSDSSGLTPDRLEMELMRQVVEGKESNVTFEEFPYYLR